MQRTILGALLAGALAFPAAAQAQDWPTRPPTVVVPFAAGGPIDVVARILSPRMTELLGQQVIIDNIPGAGGMVGASRVGKAALEMIHASLHPGAEQMRMSPDQKQPR